MRALVLRTDSTVLYTLYFAQVLSICAAQVLQ
jgi:hypothetical protein